MTVPGHTVVAPDASFNHPSFNASFIEMNSHLNDLGSAKETHIYAGLREVTYIEA